MRVDALRTWHWMLISVGVGALIGYSRQGIADDLELRFGQPLNDQRRFEEALVRKSMGRFQFDHVSVFGADLLDRKGKRRRFQIVSGEYFDGRFSPENGKLVPRWRPAFFIALVPFHPLTLESSGRPDLVRKFQSLASATVADYLRLERQRAGIWYVHAWWQELGIIGWTALSFLLIGVIWPIGINLIVYRSWRRPPVEKGISLLNVKGSTTTAPVATPVAEVPAELLEEMEATLESVSVEAPADEAAKTPPIVVLDAGPAAETSAPAAETTAFDAKQDDFYPTAKRPNPSTH